MHGFGDRASPVFPLFSTPAQYYIVHALIGQLCTGTSLECRAQRADTAKCIQTAFYSS